MTSHTPSDQPRFLSITFLAFVAVIAFLIYCSVCFLEEADELRYPEMPSVEGAE